MTTEPSNAGQSSRPLKRCLVIGGSLCFLAITAVCFAWATRDRGWEDNWRKRVRVEVPLGSSKQYTVAWLSRNSEFQPTTLMADDTMECRGFDTVQGLQVDELAGFAAGEVSSLVRTTVRRKDLAADSESDHMCLYFFFNGGEKLIGHYFLPFHERAQFERSVADLRTD